MVFGVLGLTDNIALNDFKMHCAKTNTELTTGLNSTVQPGGTWNGFKYCPNGLRAKGFRLKQHELIVADNTAANGIRLICEDDSEISASNDGPWGSWSDPIFCSNYYLLCGFRVQVQGILSGDDSSINNIDFKCCPQIEPVSEHFFLNIF